MVINNNDLKLIIYDFDGVMTDNRAMIFNDGSEAVFINRSDGFAISKIKEAGLLQIIITTEKNDIVNKRAEKLNIPIYSNIEDKLKCLKTIIKEKNIFKEEILYIGNDINDLDAMLFVGYPVAPNDAHESIKNISKIITNKSGGDGVIREVFDILFNKNSN